MRYVVKARIRTLLAQQSGHIQLLIFAPILTLFLLSLVVRTANSAIDPTLEKKKITQQLKQRLFEVRNAEGGQLSLGARAGSAVLPAAVVSLFPRRVPLALRRRTVRRLHLAAAVRSGRQGRRAGHLTPPVRAHCAGSAWSSARPLPQYKGPV